MSTSTHLQRAHFADEGISIEVLILTSTGPCCCGCDAGCAGSTGSIGSATGDAFGLKETVVKVVEKTAFIL